MFKRLRERIAEEATKFPVGQLNNNSGKQLSDSESKTTNENPPEDLITLSDSSAVVVPQTSPRQFSIGDEDGSTSEQNTPQKKQNDAACISTSEQPSYNAGQRNTPHGTGSDLGYAAEYRPSRSSYVPQSDIESEREDPPTLNLESISKDQLLTIIDLLKARVYKYKNKYSEVVKNYKEIRDEKLKIENTLIEHQDKGLRRMAELREQCQLEQKAKAHLEANLRLLMEEKDSRISVLETQINLLKEGGRTDMKTFLDGDAQHSDASSGDLSLDQDNSSLKEKIERLEHQSSQAKRTITSQTDQISTFKKQNESLSHQLEKEVKKLSEMQDQFKKLESDHEDILKNMQVRLEELEKKEEESVMSMAETKRNMHVELEIKEKQLKKAEGEAKEFQNNYDTEKLKVADLHKKTEERILKLQHQLESTEKMLEDEKQNLMQELTRGKTAAITLMQQECDKKLLRIEEEWKVKLQDVQAELEKNKLSQTEDDKKKVIALEKKLKLSQKHTEELQSFKLELEKENNILKRSLERLESEFAINSAKLENLQVEYMDLKKFNEAESLRYEEKLKHELNDRLQIYEQTESDNQHLREFLREQLNEKQNVIDDMVHNKNALYNQIDELEKREKELNKKTEALETEVKELKCKLQDLKIRLETVSENNNSKTQELCNLHKHLEQVQSNENNLVKELDECKIIVECLKLENCQMELSVNLLTEDSEKKKAELYASNKEVAFLNNALQDAESEFNILKETLDQKLSSFSKLVSQYAEIESSITLLESGDQNMKSTIVTHEKLCNEMSGKVQMLCKAFKSIQKSNSSCNKYNIKEECSLEISNTCNKNESTPHRESSTENKMSEMDIANTNLPALENLNLECTDVKKLQNTINDLLKENRKLNQELTELKELSEIQSIEFAKNITQLNESLNELQDERNNLSLVLQSIETQEKEINLESSKSVEIDKENINSVGISKNELHITELNNKVKSEITALSSQTELVNQELKNLREQFNFSQLTYSEKVAQLNSKLMVRTEQLISIKQDLDASVESGKQLQCLLDSMREQLSEKDELIRVSEKHKHDVENKCKALSEKFLKQELSLKQMHNSQLSALKDQTKATIEKLNVEIQKANATLKENEVQFQKKVSDVKDQHDQEELNSKVNSEHILQCKNSVSNIVDRSVSFEKDFFNSLKSLDVYNSKIINLNAKLNQVLTKLQDKDSLIVNQQTQISDLENQIKFLIDENNDLKNLKDKVKVISDLLEKSKFQLEKEMSERKLHEENLLNLKESHAAEIKKVENKNSVTKVEVVNLKSSFDETASELESTKVRHDKVCSDLENAKLELKDLKQQNICLRDSQLHCDSVVRELDSVKDRLEKEKVELLTEIESVKVMYAKVCSDLESTRLEIKELAQQNTSLHDSQLHFDSLVKELESAKGRLEKEKEEIVTEIDSTKVMYAKVCSDLENAELELKELKQQNICLQDSQSHYDSVVKELESAKDSLVKEKNSRVKAIKAVSEWESLYKNIQINLDLFVLKANENMENITLNIDKNESKLKSFESHFGNVSLKLKAQITEKCELQNELAKIKDFNKQLTEDIESRTMTQTQSKQDLEQKIKNITETEKTFRMEIQMKLDDTLSKLTVAEANNDLQRHEINSLQCKLKDSLAILENTEIKLEEEKIKVSAVENRVKEWEIKCNLAVVAAKKASDAEKLSGEKSQKLIEEIKEKNFMLDSMVPKEEMEALQKLTHDKSNQVNAKIDDLQKLVDSLSMEVAEKKSMIKKIQNEQVNLETRSDESLKCLKDKLENAEKNHITQVDEMKSRLSLLEKEKLVFKTEKAELLKGQEKLTDLKNMESAIKIELKSKEEELRKLQLKHDTTTKDQSAKIHSFQETMKDKENMILKLKANIETLNKDNLEKNEELRKKIKALEVEREQLMMQAQERVSITEAKYREDIKTLQEKNNKLVQENGEMEKLKIKIEQLVKEDRENCSLLEATKEEILQLKGKLSKTEERLSEAQNLKQSSEAELLGKLQLLQEENSSLLGKTNHVESLKAEKEELNEKLKEAEHQVTSIKALETERDSLKADNADLLKQLDALKSDQGEDLSLKEKCEFLKESENNLRIELDNFKSNKEDLESKLLESKTGFETEIQVLKLENEKLSKQIGMLEKFHSSDPDSTSVKEYIGVVRGECETAIKAKEEEMETKLKHLVRDFCIQMDVKDKDCDKMIAEMIEKSQDIEDRLLREHRKEASELRQSLFERECALDEMRDHYEETLQKKEKRIKELQQSIKKITDVDPAAFGDVPPISEEGSDWDDTWAVPDESVEIASPIDGVEPCKDHLQQIESLQEEVTKCNSEIKELKILLRLSPPESMVNNNNRRDSMQSIPEPTEFEYLKNIIYEYMMGKEPITLAKVIAAVLRFSDSQTQQVIRREEARHPTIIAVLHEVPSTSN